MLFYILLIILLILIMVILEIKVKTYSYWRNKGVKGPTPWPIFGNYGGQILMKKSAPQILKLAYEQYPDEKVVGLYKGFIPILLIRDPDIVKHILIGDFNSFHLRGFGRVSYDRPGNLFAAEGHTWKLLRQKFTPAFTSKKLKDMTPLIRQCAKNYIKHVDSILENKEHDVKSLTSIYMIDVVGSCIFGLDLKVYFENPHVLMKTVNKICKPSMLARIVEIVELLVPGFKKFVGLKDMVGVRQFFSNLVRIVINEREGKPMTRNNIMDILIEMKEKDRMERKYNGKMEELVVDNSMIEAQALIFYAAGIETSSSTMAFMLHELALHQNVQERLYRELTNVSNKNKEEINYESLEKFTYLQMVIHETLRKHTISGSLLRIATVDYNVPGTNIRIDKGTLIRISADGLHNDAKYFKNPSEFNPDNFSAENRKKIPACAFIPFGAGPRNCIGMRFSEVAMMIGTAAFLLNYKVVPSSSTERELVIDPQALTLKTVGGLWLKIVKRC